MDTAVTKGLSAALVFLVLSLSSAAFAHTTVVLGTLSAEPSAPEAGAAFTLSLVLSDPTELPIEGGVVVAEFQRPGAETISVPLPETDQRGVYAASLTLPEPGDYTLTLRDRTFRQEEARVSVALTLGDGPLFLIGENSVVFPPTATASANSSSTLIIWLIVIPITVGIFVTVLVLRSPPRAAPGS